MTNERALSTKHGKIECCVSWFKFFIHSIIRIKRDIFAHVMLKSGWNVCLYVANWVRFNLTRGTCNKVEKKSMKMDEWKGNQRDEEKGTAVVLYLCALLVQKVTIFSAPAFHRYATIYIYFHATLDARYVIHVLTIKLGHIVIST